MSEIGSLIEQFEEFYEGGRGGGFIPVNRAEDADANRLRAAARPEKNKTRDLVFSIGNFELRQRLKKKAGRSACSREQRLQQIGNRLAGLPGGLCCIN